MPAWRRATFLSYAPRAQRGELGAARMASDIAAYRSAFSVRLTTPVFGEKGGAIIVVGRACSRQPLDVGSQGRLSVPIQTDSPERGLRLAWAPFGPREVSSPEASADAQTLHTSVQRHGPARRATRNQHGHDSGMRGLADRAERVDRYGLIAGRRHEPAGVHCKGGDLGS